MRRLLPLIVTLFSVLTATASQEPYYWKGAFNAAYARLEKNLRAPSKKNPYWHAHPAPKYPGVYMWDSAFISLIWKHKNWLVAQDIIKSVLHNQQPDGRIAQTVSLMGVSPRTNPAVLAWAANDILSLSHDTKFAAEVYPKLRKYHQWLWYNRRIPVGLFFWKDAYESGIDNSPRFGVRDESHYDDTTRIAAVDITSYAIIDARALVSIANLLIASNEKVDRQQLQQDIALFNDHIDRTTVALNHYLWDEQTGMYYDYDLNTNSLRKISTVAGFFPLVAHAASQDQFLRLRDHAMNPREYNTTFPFPTVAHNDPMFEKDMWRGPVWINTSFLAIRGFREYGDQAAVNYFASHLVDSVYQVWSRTGDFYEFYDPDRYDFVEITRKKGLGAHLFGRFYLQDSNNPLKVISQLVLKQFILGTKPVNHFMGWTGLVNNLAIEELGFDPASGQAQEQSKPAPSTTK